MYFECHQCKSQNQDGSKFCKQCGSLLYSEQAQPASDRLQTVNPICSKCHFANADNALFCNQCGSSLNVVPKPKPVIDQPPSSAPATAVDKNSFGYRAGKWWAGLPPWGRFNVIAGGFVGLAVLLAIVYPSDSPSPKQPYISPLDLPSASPGRQSPSPQVQSTPNQSSKAKTEQTEAAQPPESRYNPSNPASSPMEYKLAYLDSKGYVAPDDPKITRIRYLLETISKKTGDSKEAIGDRTGRATLVARQNYGKVISNLDFLEQANEMLKSGIKMKYEDVSALLLMTLTQ